MSEDSSSIRVGPVTQATTPPPYVASKPDQFPAVLQRLRRLCVPYAALLGAVIVTGLAFFNYLWTLAPTVLSADSGRFQARAFVLSIGHPTGYPTFIMLGKLFSYLPFGDVAYRVNLSSAVYAAAAVFLLYLIIHRLAGTAPAVIATLAFAVARTFWSQAVIAEVYTLNALFYCAVLLTLLLWKDRRQERFLLAAAFLCGLSMTNHMTSGLLIPCALLLIWLTDRSQFHDWKLLSKAAVLVVVGLTPYLYLPIRAAMDPPMNYANPTNLDRFLRLVFGSQFSGRMWSFGPADLPRREAMYWVDLRAQFALVLLVLAVIGLRRGLQVDKAVFIPLLSLFAANLFYALEYDIFDIHVYFIPTHLVLAIWMAFGLRVLLEWLETLRSESWRRAARIGLTLVLLLTVGLSWWIRYPAVDQSDNYETARLMDAVARAPRRALIYDPRSLGLVQYLQYVQGRRRDLEVRDVSRSNVQQYLEQDLSTGRHVYVVDTFLQDVLKDRYLTLPRGELWRVIPNDRAEFALASYNFRKASEWLEANRKAGSIITNPGVDRALRSLGFEATLISVTADRLDNSEGLPPDVRQQAEDVRWVYSHATGPETRAILDRYDVSYLVLMKRFRWDVEGAQESQVGYAKYRKHEDLYKRVFENDMVIIYEVLR